MRLVRSFLIVLGVSLLLARLGPYNTFRDLLVAERVSYWVGLTLLLWVQIEAVLYLLRTIPRAAHLHWAVRAVIAALLAAIPGTFEVVWAESLLRFERDLGFMDVILFYGDVGLIAVALTLLLEWLNRPKDPVGAEEIAAGDRGPQGEGLLAALPTSKRGALIAFAAEDHYLRVYTDKGESLIHKRFSDALADVAGLGGSRVHRSWWVARNAVTGREREGDRLVLLLSNGLRVPVSRTYLMGAREAGLLPA